MAKSLDFRVKVLLVNTKILEMLPHKIFQTQKWVNLTFPKTYPYIMTRSIGTNNLAVPAVCKNFILMTPFPAPGKTWQSKANPVFGQEPTGQGTSGQGDGDDNGNSSRTNINQLNQLKIQQSEANWARKVIKNPAPIYLKLRSFNEGVLTDYLLYGLVNDTIKKNLKRATGSVIESLSLNGLI